MNERTENRIEGWDSKPLTGGFAELDELADGGFSGVARTRGTTLYMLNGRVVGVFGESIDDFADAEATAYQAPHPSLPLLFAMKEYGGEQQAKYYTNDTPISEAHQQLSDAQFTGYVELSENVLSGDYYVVYYGGRSMSCAFVGNSERLEVGDDAFQLADDEVGIYEVMSVDVEVTDIPAQESGAAGGSDAPGAAGGDVGAAPSESEAAGGPTEPDPAAESGSPDAASEREGSSGSGNQRDAEAARSGADAGGTTNGVDSGSPPSEDDSGTASSDAGAGTTPGSEDVDPHGRTPAGPGGEGSSTGEGGPGPTESDAHRADESVTDSAGTDAPGTDAAPGSTGESDATDRSEPSEPASSPASGGSADQAEPSGGAADAQARRTTDTPEEPSAPAPDHQAETSTTDAGPRTGNSSEVSPTESDADARSDAAADRAVEAASGPGGSSAAGAATTGEGVPKSEAALGELRPIPSLSPDQTAVAEPGEERGAGDSGDEASTAAGGGASTAGDSGRGSNTSDPAVDANGGSVEQRGAERTGSTGGARTGATDPTGAGPSDASRTGPNDSPGTGSTETSGTRGSNTGGTDVTERATREVDVEAAADPEPVSGDAGNAELRQQLRARAERIEELEAAITDLRVQRDGLTDERDRLESEVQRLEAEVNDLESEVQRLQSRLKDGTEGKQRLSQEDALTGTNLFIRYDSKSGGTLDKAHGGKVGREEVNNNLRIEHHTQFDADDVVVADEPFDDFLRGTIYRGFVEWVVRDLLYEIQDTGHVKELSDLYDAIPRIDRAELLGDVSVQYTEDGEQYREQRSFDVVLRDRMGNPLIVANLNDSRNPADRDMMESVIHNGIDVKESNESLASAMMVTASFFKPGALEAADESAGGGLLSRDAKRSYVKVNRKMGYHLVLVESRDDDFHVNVPEL